MRQQHDKFVVMEPDMAERLVAFGVERENVTCLDVPDRYERGCIALVKRLEEKLAAMIQ